MLQLVTGVILVAVEHAHRCYLVIAKLAVPVELQEIVEAAIGSIAFHLTTIGSPCCGWIVVDILLPCGVAGIRIDPLALRIHIKVGNTSFYLHHRVVERQLTGKLQSLGYEIQFLGKNEVGGNLCIGSALLSASGKRLHGVRTVGRTRRIITICSVAVDRAHGIRSSLIDRTPECIDITTGTQPRFIADAITTKEVG